MRVKFGLFSLLALNSCIIYLIYYHLAIACSLIVDNILGIPHEPSGMQLFFFVISFVFFLSLSFLSILHSFYFNLNHSLFTCINITWIAYFIVLIYLNLSHNSASKAIFYYACWIISILGIVYVCYITYRQIYQLVNNQDNSL
jgi:hypothetical protein